jgi:hypothetical protein
LTQYTQQLTFEQAMHDMDRGLPPRNIYPEPAARGSHDAEGRLAGYFQGNEEVPQSAEQEQEFPTQEPRSEHPHSYHDEHNRLFDGSGRCLDDLHALQPQSLAAFAPSSFTETAQQQRGNAPALSLTTPSINSELFFNPADLDLYDDNMNPLDPPPGWQSSAFDDTANVLGTYNQQYGSSYAQHPLSSPSDPVRAVATQRRSTPTVAMMNTVVSMTATDAVSTSDRHRNHYHSRQLRRLLPTKGCRNTAVACPSRTLRCPLDRFLKRRVLPSKRQQRE